MSPSQHETSTAGQTMSATLYADFFAEPKPPWTPAREKEFAAILELEEAERLLERGRFGVWLDHQRFVWGERVEELGDRVVKAGCRISGNAVIGVQEAWALGEVMALRKPGEDLGGVSELLAKIHAEAAA